MYPTRKSETEIPDSSGEPLVGSGFEAEEPEVDVETDEETAKEDDAL